LIKTCAAYHLTKISTSRGLTRASELCVFRIHSLVALFVILACMPLQGQNIVVSEEVPLKNDYAYEIIGKLNGNILLFRDMQNQYEVHAFDQELRWRWQRVIAFEKRNAQVIAVVPGDTSFHVIYGYRDKGDYYLKHNHYDAHVRVIDSTTISVIKSLYFAPRFLYALSEDRTKVLLFRTDKETELQVGAYDVYKKKMLWRKKLLFQNGSIRRDFRQMLVSDEGDMFLIMDHERSSRRRKEFAIIRVEAGDRVMRKRYAVLENYTAYDMHAAYDNLNKRLALAGLYSEKSITRSQGLYMFTMGLHDKNVDLHLIPFHPALLEEIHGKEVSTKKGLSDFRVKEIIFRQDGGALLIAEMHKEYNRRPSVPGHVDYGPNGWVDYYLEDLLVYSVNADGTDHWNTVLHKKQYSQDDDAMYSSFFVFKSPEKIHLIYNDEIRNENTVSEYVLRGNGYYKRNSVFSTNYQRLMLRFRDGLQIAYNECIVPSERNNRLNLVRITFSD
jgi:hypothetical protein